MAAYELPDLPYDYGALAPHISGEIMELHHSKHHATYVKGLNTALDKLAEAREDDSFGSVNGLEKNLAFHLGGHINHSVFWPNMSPDGGDKPDGDLAARSTSTSAASTSSGRTSRRTPTPSRAPAGRCSSGTRSASGSNIVQLYDQQANLPLGADPDRAAGHVGARVLPAVQERQGRLRQGVVERRQLGRRAGPLRCGQGADRWADRASVINF